jgi:hypothetical protein
MQTLEKRKRLKKAKTVWYWKKKESLSDWTISLFLIYVNCFFLNWLDRLYKHRQIIQFCFQFNFNLFFLKNIGRFYKPLFLTDCEPSSLRAIFC